MTNLRLETETDASYQVFELFDVSKTARNFSNFEFSPAPVGLSGERTAKAGKKTDSGFKILHASLRHIGQFVPIRLNAQTTTSTTCAEPTAFSLPHPSEPGSGIRPETSASITYSPSDTRS
jgi:hypothetical protein